MNTRLAVLLIALTVPALSGCGNKGPLVRASEPELTEIPESTPAEDADATTDEPAVDPASDSTPPPAESAPVEPSPTEPTPVEPTVQPTLPEVPPQDDGDDGDDGTE